MKGMLFEKVEAHYDESGKRSLIPTGEDLVFMEADDVLMAIGQENSFPWIERDLGVEFDKWEMPVVDKTTFQSTNPRVFFGGDSAFGPENIITAVAHGHQAAISIDLLCRGEPVANRPPPMTNLASQKMGVHEWSYDNAVAPDQRYAVPHAPLDKLLKDRKLEVELGFDPGHGLQGSGALPELRCADGVRGSALYRVRRLCRYLPDRLHHLYCQRPRAGVAHPPVGPGEQPGPGPLCIGGPADQAGDGQG